MYRMDKIKHGGSVFNLVNNTILSFQKEVVSLLELIWVCNITTQAHKQILSLDVSTAILLHLFLT